MLILNRYCNVIVQYVQFVNSFPEQHRYDVNTYMYMNVEETALPKLFIRKQHY